MLLRDFAARTFPGVPLWEQYRLGPTSSSLVGVEVTPALEAALRVSNWFADGILPAANETLVIEAKMKPTPAAISQVQFYAGLIGRTPGMSGRLNLPINTAVLFAESDPAVTAFAQAHGCRVYVYTPPWIADYLTQVQFRPRSTDYSKAPSQKIQAENSP
jgi:hypothetical protein